MSCHPTLSYTGVSYPTPSYLILPHPTLDSHQIDPTVFEVATSLMKTMSGYFADESKRQQAFLSEVRALFPECVCTALTRGRAVSDATLQVAVNNHWYNVVNWEFKNEFKHITSEPHAQNLAYFVHLQQDPDLYQDRAPLLLATVVGCHHFQVFGAAWHGSKVYSDPLCSPVSLLFVPRDPTQGVTETARVLAALQATVKHLHQYYARPASDRLACTTGPYYCSEMEAVKELQGIKWLFTAKWKGNDVVVKFARFHYGHAAHACLAACQRAPQILQTDRLPGQWHAVVMEKVEGVPLHRPVSSAVVTQLHALVSKLHTAGCVRDLRPQNILMTHSTQSLCIVDFDWAGQCAEVRYPRELNTSCDWHPEVTCGGLITPAHDLYQITQMEEPSHTVTVQCVL